MAVALRLVESQQFRDEVSFDSSNAKSGSHSLLTGFSHNCPWPAAVTSYVIKRFSELGNLVVDQFCATGHFGVESAMLGRRYVGSSADQLLVTLAQGRIDPADIAEVALRLQLLNLKRPVDVRNFQAPFTLFFDVDTFCELVNLRSTLYRSGDRVDRFIQHVVAGVIHGHTVGHLSGYTSPHFALTQDAQAELNRKRGELPSYRAVAPRILRRAAMLLQDGIPDPLQNRTVSAECVVADPRDLSHISTGEAQLVALAPEQPGFIQHDNGSWLRSWWFGIERNSSTPKFAHTEDWSEYCNELLFESARVTKKGGRCVVRLGSGKIGVKKVNYASALPKILEQGLSQYWKLEGTVVENDLRNAEEGNKNPSNRNSNGPRSTNGEIIVLRRK